MADGNYGRARKITVTLRPRSASKPNRPSRRKTYPASNAVIFSDPAKNHVATSFPLFSSNLVAKKPPIQKSNRGTNESNLQTKQAQSVRNTSRTRLTRREQSSPTPVEQVTARQRVYDAPGDRQGKGTTAKPELVHVESACGEESPDNGRSSTCSQLTDISHVGDVFPFQHLPDDCKLKVFSFLSSHDKGRCSQVRHSYTAN